LNIDMSNVAMGRVRFLIYPWFIFRFVGEQTQTSLGLHSNDATYEFLSVSRGRPALGQIVFGTLNHATC